MFAIQLKNINKSFGSVRACQDITFSVKTGHIHALVGENGAGKSTLMKILYGLIAPDTGEIKINEKTVNMQSSQVAIKNGLGMVHQHLKLIPTLTVFENIILGQEPSRYGVLKLDDAREKIEELVSNLGFNLDLNELVENLSLGEQQRLEIIKSLYRDVRVLILDEPTAVLGPMETEELFVLLDNLRKEGCTIIFISHKLEEVISLADEITVMRAGQYVKTLSAKEVDAQKLACLMMGKEIILPENKHQAKQGEVILSLKNLYSKPQQGQPGIQNFSMRIHAGEILGLAGVAGNGQSELVELLTGLRKVDRGQMFLMEEDVTNLCPKKLRQAGVAHIPEDRHHRAIVEDFTVQENLLLGQHYHKRWQSRGFWRTKEIKDGSQTLVEKFNVQPPDTCAQIKSFSGGNQQKIVFAREISQPYNFLIACQPTRGLDLAASAYVYEKLLKEKSSGKAILLVSTELEEIVNLSDRIGVIFRGQLMDIFEAGEISSEKLGKLMGGMSNN